MAMDARTAPIPATAAGLGRLTAIPSAVPMPWITPMAASKTAASCAWAMVPTATTRSKRPRASSTSCAAGRASGPDPRSNAITSTGCSSSSDLVSKRAEARLTCCRDDESARQLLVHGGADLLERKRLGDDALDQRFEVVRALTFAGEARHQEDPDRRMILADLERERDAVEPRHDD